MLKRLCIVLIAIVTLLITSFNVYADVDNKGIDITIDTTKHETKVSNPSGLSYEIKLDSSLFRYSIKIADSVHFDFAADDKLEYKIKCTLSGSNNKIKNIGTGLNTYSISFNNLKFDKNIMVGLKPDNKKPFLYREENGKLNAVDFKLIDGYYTFYTDTLGNYIFSDKELNNQDKSEKGIEINFIDNIASVVGQSGMSIELEKLKGLMDTDKKVLYIVGIKDGEIDNQLAFRKNIISSIEIEDLKPFIYYSDYTAQLFGKFFENEIIAISSESSTVINNVEYSIKISNKTDNHIYTYDKNGNVYKEISTEVNYEGDYIQFNAPIGIDVIISSGELKIKNK